LKGQGYKLRKKGRKVCNKTDKLTVTAEYIFTFNHEKSPVHDGGLGQNNSMSFHLYDAKSTINRILRLALNVVQYYNVRLRVIANVTTAITIAASEERKNCQIRKT
jgi:hypothetical protein